MIGQNGRGHGSQQSSECKQWKQEMHLHLFSDVVLQSINNRCLNALLKFAHFFIDLLWINALGLMVGKFLGINYIHFRKNWGEFLVKFIGK